MSYSKKDSDVELFQQRLVGFLGCGEVLMDDGQRKRVDQLRAGDLVDGTHRVKCVIKTMTGHKALIVRLGTGGWTPNHPVLYNNVWHLPLSIGEVSEEDCEAVYNFVLESGHFLTIGSVKTCTIGHEFQGPVIEHPFYGKRRAGVPHMLDILEESYGYYQGLVVLEDVEFEKDSNGYSYIVKKHSYNGYFS